MHMIYAVRNGHTDELEVWVEPWCHLYKVPRGSVLTFLYDAASEEEARVDTEPTPERLVVWFSTKFDPKAELDGNPVQPSWD